MQTDAPPTGLRAAAAVVLVAAIAVALLPAPPAAAAAGISARASALAERSGDLPRTAVSTGRDYAAARCFSDPIGDTRRGSKPDPDLERDPVEAFPRADITEHCVDFGETALELGVRVAEPTAPSEWVGETDVFWVIGTQGDDVEGDHFALVLADADAPDGLATFVLDADFAITCELPGALRDGRYLTGEIPASCIGDATTVRTGVVHTVDVEPDVDTGTVYTDIAPNTAELSPEVVRDARGVRRISGSGRYETAAAVSRDAFDPPVGRVWVATGEGFADALAAGAAAAADGAPVVTTSGAALAEAARDELVRLQPAEVAVVGGPGAVSDGTLAQIRTALPQADVVRVSGPDRFATAVAIAEAGFPDAPEVLYIATGGTFPDALAAVPAAAADGAALLLVNRDSLPAATRAYLREAQPSSVVVVGGVGAVAESVADEIARVSGARVTRVSGASRFDTAAALLARTPAAEADELSVASGDAFPDALAGGPAAALRATGILLTSRDALPAPTRSAISAVDPALVTILGGAGAVSEAVRDAIAAIPR
jgi:putative cell wall-binding protein